MSPEPAESFQIFISYRRKGTDIHAGRLYDSLRKGEGDIPGFAADQIFMDIDTLRPGDDFREVIREHVAKCDVLLAVIGEQWVKARGKNRQRRLDDPGDYVRLEIEAALERKIPVVPVLMYGATMPREDDLPVSLVPLVYREASELEHRSWSDDVSRLLSSLKERESDKTKTSRPPARRTTQPGGTAKRTTATSRSGTPSTRKTAKPKSTTEKRKTSISAAPKPTPSTESPFRRSSPQPLPTPQFTVKPGNYQIGDIYIGRIESFKSDADGFGAKVTLGILTWGTLRGERVFPSQLLGPDQMKTPAGDTLSVGDMIRVQIINPISLTVRLPFTDARHSLTFLSRVLPGSKIGPST